MRSDNSWAQVYWQDVRVLERRHTLGMTDSEAVQLVRDLLDPPAHIEAYSERDRRALVERRARAFLAGLTP
jgi:hypothetical protein